ncbi:alsin isoform X1 [Nothobranchius furzeri]|uniref:Alsin Rho guanine nucleotide exchange factor ALS2 n=1 Tax=Nothobranchius furzeri TaxID=105023 RepID=A0A1A7ZPX0_NOTFU|nr:alsin isoform X1 [Nothobranchius furzeri]KAF7216143.1 transcript variant X1 [Nothobranchius furzeri]
MENQEERAAEEQASAAPERGLLHVWRSVGCSHQLYPERVLLSAPVQQVSLGEHHGLLLAQGGQVFSFGELSWKGLSIPVSAPVLEVSLRGKNVVRVAAGGFHCGAIIDQGHVYMWGENTAGQCGGSAANITVSEPSPVSVVDTEVVPPVSVRVVDLACGREHSLALSARNELWAWGSGCQLGLVTTTFPVWKPQKVEHLAGRHVIQVACGAYHSLALVRSLPAQDTNPPKIKEQGQSPRCPAAVRDELFTSDDSHYCPLGVELTEVMTSETSPRRQTPRRRLHPQGMSSGSSPGSAATFPSFSVECRSNSKQNLCRTLPVSAESEESTDSESQTDGRSKDHLVSSWRTNKNSDFPDELELQNLLEKLSDHSLESDRTTAAGDADSVSSHTSDDSCVSSAPSSDLLNSSYNDDSASKRQTVSISGSYPSPPVCLEEVRLCLQKERQALQGQKSSSLTNIHQKGKSAASRRRSHPGTPTHGSPQRRRPCVCRPFTSAQTPAAGPDEAGDGLPSLDTEVWSWGRGSEGQLGHGDQLARLQPLCIKPLTGQEVIKVTAGSHHSLALTAQCLVYSWGSNMCGQLGHVNSPVTVPQRVKQPGGLRVWDLSAGQSHSLFLANGDCVQPVLLYCGQQQPPSQQQLSCSSCQSSPTKVESCTVRPSPLPFRIETGYICSVRSGGQMCAASTDINIQGFVAAIHELASRERGFYCWLSDFKKVFLTPLRKKERVCLALGELCTHLFFSLCETFLHLSVLVGRHATSLSYFLHNAQSRDVTSFPLLTHTQHFLDIYKKYCLAVGDFQVMGGFQSLHKASLECMGHQLTLLSQLNLPDQLVSGDVDLVSMFYWPLQQLHHYNRVLLKMAACYDVLTVEYQSLHQGCSQFETLSSFLLRKQKEAESTFVFWKTQSGKANEALQIPQRRVVCESSNRSLVLQNSGRFSSHWFILFNDVLVHMQGAIPSQSFLSTHRVFPLTCLWVKPVTDDSSGLYAIKITCPEESFTLVASTPQEKNKWLRSLNQAVDQVLGGGGQRSSPGVTAMSRTTSYMFTMDERLKDAQYTGSWHAGRVHGRGTMKWPDGRTYKGNFKNGLEDGYGECLIPNKGQDKPDTYQGQWREGKIHGFGKYKYASGEVYEGCFCDGQRHGYGMQSSGKLARTSSSVFIGNWVHDKKEGYGVNDDITRGEKYMGMWLEDQRHGNAVVVTQYGLYYEGTFKDNKMIGPGLLISEDDTVFHGEFSENWTISGNGVLTLANGDCLDGAFAGEWRKGLKVTGTYTKPALEERDHKEKNIPHLGQYVVPAAQRWTCVFGECWSRLGCDAAGRGERTAAWENIAVTITTARRQGPDLSKSQSKVLESLEFIPQYGEPVTTENYDGTRRYLAKACETPHHPLGWLVETLVTAYRMTYVGVGSNRRLLQQAVQELQAYLAHFYTIIRFLFPGLPDDGGVIPEPSQTRRNSELEHGVVVMSTSSLLLPVLLPRLYPPLFTLYCLQKEQEEAQYWERILRLNKHPDQSLLSFLGVQEKFWPHWMSILGEKKQIVSSSRDACFVSAVETLQQISTTFTPADKLVVIQKTFEELTLEEKPFLDGDFLWCMDDLFPLFLYVVLRARIRNLGAEVSLIEDLMDPNIQHGEMGLMFTTLKACYIQIQHESTT